LSEDPTISVLIEQGPVAGTWTSRVPLLSANPYTKETMAARCIIGTLGDYNQWRALGNDGWGYEDLESYFVRSEKTSGHMFSKYRGSDGE
ncbi:hypothetical protein BD309DRAFT_861380, partial [Dichomitus squalens]